MTGGMHTLHATSTSLEQSSRLATASISDAYARLTPTSTFVQGFLFLLDRQYRAHLFNCGRLIPLYREAHPHSRDNVGVRTSETSAEGKLDVLRATLLIVSRLRSDGGLGVDRECDGGNAATLSTSSRSGKGAPTGVGRC